MAAPVSIRDSLQRLQQEVDQLKQKNAVILALQQTYDEKIVSLEQQTEWRRNLSPLLGKIFLCFDKD